MPLTLTARHKIEIAASCAALLLAALIFHAWLAAHDDQLRLASTLATQNKPSTPPTPANATATPPSKTPSPKSTR